MCTVTFVGLFKYPLTQRLAYFWKHHVTYLLYAVLKASNYSPAQHNCITGCSVLDYVEPDQWILVDWVDMQTSCRVLAGTNVEGSGEMLKVVVVLLDQLLTLCIRQIKRCLHQVVPLWPVISQLQTYIGWVANVQNRQTNVLVQLLKLRSAGVRQQRAGRPVKEQLQASQPACSWYRYRSRYSYR